MTDGLKAGRELDERVAREAMGWELIQHGGWGLRTSASTLRVMKMDTEQWRPSTDIAAAWELAEKYGLSVIRSLDGWYAVKADDIVHEFDMLLVVGENRALADTAPLAICLAALKAAASQAEQEGR